MSWYNNVFYDKVPEKGEAMKFAELPRIPKDEDIDNEEEIVQKQQELVKKHSNLDFVFSAKFNFSQMPTTKESQEAFLNGTKSREQNPANLPTEGFSVIKPFIASTIEPKFSAIRSAIGNAVNSFTSNIGLNYVYSLYKGSKAVRGGGSGTQKRNKYRSKKTQRKILL